MLHVLVLQGLVVFGPQTLDLQEILLITKEQHDGEIYDSVEIKLMDAIAGLCMNSLHREYVGHSVVLVETLTSKVLYAAHFPKSGDEDSDEETSSNEFFELLGAANAWVKERVQLTAVD